MGSEAHHAGAGRPRKTLILCFDGTGNKFQGTQADSNIVKIFSLLDRQDANAYHYYQPGIGTYVETGSLSQKSRFGRIKSWYVKAKDQAVGTSFGEHVMAGYKFLMRYYNDGDAIYFFGFSRGAYTARFLAQMLDYVGLLSAGNEEMLRFAWKTFARWQMRTEESEREREKKKETFEFMKKFRETFSRPICRIEFLGLFDCVNSVPQFESAWMSRTKFPYTAKTSARVIRHAVSIDERRAKFRSDLISGEYKATPRHPHLDKLTGHHHSEKGHHDGPSKRPSFIHHTSQTLFRPKNGPKLRKGSAAEYVPSSAASQISVNSATPVPQARPGAADNDDDADFDDEDHQDILELWFAGQHGDIGGGWTLHKDEQRPLSDIALMWMLKEAQKAGLPIDKSKLKASCMFLEDPQMNVKAAEAPILQIDGQLVGAPEPPIPESDSETLIEEINRMVTTSIVHDSLRFGGGLGWSAVTAWQIMEFLPFRRMDLQPDGSWKPISWPLPRGEVRDMDNRCLVHGSVLRRLEADPKYRPGNLIIGGGGRGLRVAPEKYGIGQWKLVGGEGIVGEYYVKVKEGEE